MADVPFSRALVVGSPGSGKSTFARGLHARTGLPLVYLDMLWHLPDHTTVPEEVFDSRLADVLVQPHWIIDGNYSRTLRKRLAYADTVFCFDLPLEVCLDGIRSRLGSQREDMPWETEVELDPEFEEYVRDFPQSRRPLLLEMLEEAQHAGKRVTVFRSRAEADRFLERLPIRP